MSDYNFRHKFKEMGGATIINIDGYFAPQQEDICKSFATKFHKTIRQLLFEIKFDIGCKGEYIVDTNVAKSGIHEGKFSYYSLDITLTECVSINQPLFLDYINNILATYPNVQFISSKK